MIKNHHPDVNYVDLLSSLVIIIYYLSTEEYIKWVLSSPFDQISAHTDCILEGS